MIRRGSSGPRSSALQVGAGSVSLALLALAGCSGESADPNDSPSSAASASPTATAPSASPTDSRLTASPPATTPIRLTMTPAQARADAPVIQDNGCHAQQRDSAAPDPEDCTFGFFDGDTVVLYGDSHAAQWFAATEEVATRHDWRLLPVTKEGCPPGDERVYDESEGAEYTECTQWHANAMRLIEEQEPILVLVAASSDDYRIVEDGTVLTVEASSDRLGQALADDVRAFADMGARTVLIRDTPAPGFDVPECIETAGPDACTYPLAEAMPNDAAQLSAARTTRTHVVDLRKEVCGDRDSCRTGIDGLITFRDAQHLTSIFAGTLADDLDAGIQALPA